MAALATAAVIALGITLALALKTTAVTATAFAATATTGIVIGAGFPIVGVLLLIGAICVLPCCFRGPSYRVSTGNYYTDAYSTSYSPSFYPSVPSVSITGDSRYHSHSQVTQTHHHDSSYPSTHASTHHHDSSYPPTHGSTHHH